MGRKMYGRDAPAWLLLTRWLMTNGYEKCQWCGVTEGLTFDHRVPFCYGGTREMHNLAILCGDCNVKKDNNYIELDPVVWPNPAFGQILAKDLTAGDHTVYGIVVEVERWETRQGGEKVGVTLAGPSIISDMRKVELKAFIEFESDQIVYLHPENSNGIDLEAQAMGLSV